MPITGIFTAAIPTSNTTGTTDQTPSSLNSSIVHCTKLIGFPTNPTGASTSTSSSAAHRPRLRPQKNRTPGITLGVVLKLISVATEYGCPPRLRQRTAARIRIHLTIKALQPKRRLPRRHNHQQHHTQRQHHQPRTKRHPRKEGPPRADLAAPTRIGTPTGTGTPETGTRATPRAERSVRERPGCESSSSSFARSLSRETHDRLPALRGVADVPACLTAACLGLWCLTFTQRTRPWTRLRTVPRRQSQHPLLGQALGFRVPDTISVKLPQEDSMFACGAQHTYPTHTPARRRPGPRSRRSRTAWIQIHVVIDIPRTQLITRHEEHI